MAYPDRPPQCAGIRRFDNALGNHHGISFSDFQVLNHLARAPGGRLRRVDLAERLGLTASGVTHTLLPLEKIGLVTRQPDPRDARVGYAAITAVGQELLLNATTVTDLVSRESIRDDRRDEPQQQLRGSATQRRQTGFCARFCAPVPRGADCRHERGPQPAAVWITIGGRSPCHADSCQNLPPT